MQEVADALDHAEVKNVANDVLEVERELEEHGRAVLFKELLGRLLHLSSRVLLDGNRQPGDPRLLGETPMHSHNDRDEL